MQELACLCSDVCRQGRTDDTEVDWLFKRAELVAQLTDVSSVVGEVDVRQTQLRLTSQ